MKYFWERELLEGAVRKHDYADFEAYKREVCRLAVKMKPHLKRICTDTVKKSFEEGKPVGLAAKHAAEDSAYWEYGVC